MPGACGSVEITDRLGAPKARSTSTTLPSLASVRASEIAAKVVPTLRAVPTTVTRRPASPACRRLRGDLVDAELTAHRAMARQAAARRHRRQRRRGNRVAWRHGGGAGGITAAHNRPVRSSPARRRSHKRAPARASSAPVTVKPADSAKAAKAAISTVGYFLRIGRLDGGRCARNDARLRRRGVDVVARGSLAVFGEIGFQQIALGLGVALERAQLHVLLVAARRASSPGRGLRSASPSCRRRAWRRCRAGAPAARPRILICAVDLGDLRPQLLDARMLVEQRGRLLGKLRAQRMRCSIRRRMASELAMSEESIGLPERMSSRSCFARASRSAFCPRAAAICELISVSCCARQRRVVGAGEQIGLGAVVVDLGFGVADLLAHLVDLAGKPGAGGAGLILRRRLLHLR